ncbi:phosphatase PAP2 family protein [Chloroflexota bacterium]
MFNTMRKYAKPSTVAFGGLVILALILSVLAHYETTFPGDLEVTLLFQSIDSRPLLMAMKGVSYITAEWRAAIVVVVTGIITWRSLGGLEGSMVGLSGLTATINEAFKIVINRPRPVADLVNVFVVETGTSFPSGHNFFAVVVLGVLAYLTIAHQTKRYMRILTASGFLILILWIGASRVYLGVHWTSDVIGGYVVGLPFLGLEIWLYQRLKLRLENKRS